MDTKVFGQFFGRMSMWIKVPGDKAVVDSTQAAWAEIDVGMGRK
jgi:hypothetical protein